VVPRRDRVAIHHLAVRRMHQHLGRRLGSPVLRYISVANECRKSQKRGKGRISADVQARAKQHTRTRERTPTLERREATDRTCPVCNQGAVLRPLREGVRTGGRSSSLESLAACACVRTIRGRHASNLSHELLAASEREIHQRHCVAACRRPPQLAIHHRPNSAPSGCV
jgi:hypothetical protein